MFRPCILIPTYNNATTIGELLNTLTAFNLTMVVVNDGSDEATCTLLKELGNTHAKMELVVREINGGKGAAVQSGLRRALELGFTHALQLDADGQHDPAQIPTFLQTAATHPEALILGAPVFGEDVPKSRLYGRQVSRIMVWLETLSFQIEDPLFGFRVYPLAATVQLIDRVSTGQRMDFDPEIAVRLCWQGLTIKNIKAKVHYPEGNSSHFQMFRDNFRLAWLHTRLLAGMLVRAPSLIARKWL